MFNVGGPEVLVILLVALIALGPAQLPEAARKVGRVVNQVRSVSTNFQRELTSAFEAEERKTTTAPSTPSTPADEKPVSPGGPTDVSATPSEDEGPD